MAKLTNCMQSGLKHNLSQCLLLVSTSSIPVDCFSNKLSGQYVQTHTFNEKKNLFFINAQCQIGPIYGGHFSGSKYAYRDVYYALKSTMGNV